MTRALLLVFISLCLAFTGSTRRALLFNRAAPEPADPCTSCTNETFEGAGYVVAGWTEFGAVANEDYSTAPAPLIDSQSLLIQNAAGATAFSALTMPTAGEGWMRFAVCLTNTVVDTWFLAIFVNAGGGSEASLRINGATLSVEANGASSASTVASISANTTNYIWFHYKKGTGTDAVVDVGFAEHPNKNRPTSGNYFAQVTDGTSTGDAVSYYIGGGDATFGGAFGGAIYDNVSLTTLGPIGHFP
jgi:hypothetical protein